MLPPQVLLHWKNERFSDGGVNLDTGRQLVEAGADALVAGSFVFHSDNPIDTIARLKQL